MIAVGVPELLILLAIVVIIFGPGRLADLGRVLGSSIKDFRRAMRADEPSAPASEPQLQTIGGGGDEQVTGRE